MKYIFSVKEIASNVEIIGDTLIAGELDYLVFVKRDPVFYAPRESVVCVWIEEEQPKIEVG